MSYRTEKDSLGDRKVPAEAYYGVQTQRAIENYPISGLRTHPTLIQAIGMIKKAAALTNAELGLIDHRRAAAIVQATEDVIAGRLNGQFPVDIYQAGAGVSFHMNANEVIANRAIEIVGGRRGDYAIIHPNDHVNFGQSTNDVFPTAMRLASILVIEELIPEVQKLSQSLHKKGQEFDNILKSGRTHMQDAVPVRLGQEFNAYGGAVARARDTIRHGQDTLRELGLGGTAVGTGVNSHPQYQTLVVQKLADISSQRLSASSDMRYAMQSNFAMAAASSGLRNYALELIRISNDLRLLSSGPNTGIGEINLPALQPGSSIMPGKINPVIPELTAMVSFQVVGADMAVAMAVQAGQLELNVMMPTMAWNVLHSAEILKTTTRQLRVKCVEGITPNPERCRHSAEATISLATALNPYIGYAKAAELAKLAIKTGRTITDLALEKRLLDPKQLKQILDPRRMTEPAPPLESARKATGRAVRKPKPPKKAPGKKKTAVKAKPSKPIKKKSAEKKKTKAKSKSKTKAKAKTKSKKKAKSKTRPKSKSKSRSKPKPKAKSKKAKKKKSRKRR